METGADVKIKGFSGTEMMYDNVPKVWLAAQESTDDNPVLVPFTYGEALEKVEIIPDFSEGDMIVTMPKGYLARSAVIRNPGLSVPDIYMEVTEEENGEVVAVALHGFTSMPRGLFAYMNSLVTVDITDSPGITAIGEYAFYQCKKLENFNIPSSVTNIGAYAFAGCEKLPNVTIPEGITAIGANAFNTCKSFTSINIPESVTEIGNMAFRYCSGLTDVQIPGNCKNIGQYAFENCVGIESVSVQEGVEILGMYAFANCSELKSVSIPSTITGWGGSVFANGKNIKSISIANGVSSIGNATFLGCTGLNNISIPSSVKKIGLNAFGQCTGLGNATFADSSGWYVTQNEGSTSGTNISISNASTAATYLRSTYAQYYWYDKT